MCLPCAHAVVQARFLAGEIIESEAARLSDLHVKVIWGDLVGELAKCEET